MADDTTATLRDDLADEQRQRAAAMRMASGALTAVSGAFSRKPADPLDIIVVAAWIVTGHVLTTDELYGANAEPTRGPLDDLAETLASTAAKGETRGRRLT